MDCDEDFQPDLVIGRPGWGEMLAVVDLLPGVTVLHQQDFISRIEAADYGFDPVTDPPRLGRLDAGAPASQLAAARLRSQGCGTVLQADVGSSVTMKGSSLGMASVLVVGGETATWASCRSLSSTAFRKGKLNLATTRPRARSSAPRGETQAIDNRALRSSPENGSAFQRFVLAKSYWRFRLTKHLTISEPMQSVPTKELYRL